MRDDRYNIFAEYWERDLYPELEREAPVYVGITITNRQQILPGLLLARRLRERGHFVVIGGALITKFTKKLPALPQFFEIFADAVIAYEGETAARRTCRHARQSRQSGQRSQPPLSERRTGPNERDAR